MPVTQLPSACPGVTDVGLRITKGDTKPFTIVLGMDLTGITTVTLTVKRNPTALDTLIIKPGSVIDVPTGKIEFDFAPADTSPVPAGFYIFTIAIGNGISMQTVMTGQFILDPFDQALVGTLEPIMDVALTTTTQRLSISIRDDQGVLANPISLELKVLDFTDTVLVDLMFPSPSLVNPEAGIFMFDFTTDRAGDYLIIWNYRFTGGEPITVIKNVRFVNTAIYRLIPEVLLYIDKSRKATGKPFAFSSVDVAVYIQNALRDFNAASPTTVLQLEDLDGVQGIYKEVLILGAVIQALIAQGLLGVDQDFTYNDNGISLGIEHSTKLLSWYQVLLQTYTYKKLQYKMNFFSPSVYARSIVGTAFALGFTHLPPSTATRFRGWI